jgi:hypothetical protein
MTMKNIRATPLHPHQQESNPYGEQRDANSRCSDSIGSVCLSGKMPMTRCDYDKLKSSGMMWEIYPEFTGDYDEDINMQNKTDMHG